MTSSVRTTCGEIEGGAKDSSHSLGIKGNCQEQQPAFAGAMFSPGDRPMQKADLSNHGSLSFWAKGDGKEYSVMLFFEKREIGSLNIN